MDTNRVNCKNCKNYFITWDPRFPNGCRLFGVKSGELPSLVVYKSLGKACENYVDRKQRE